MKNWILGIGIFVIAACAQAPTLTEAPATSPPTAADTATSPATTEIEVTEEVIPLPTETDLPTEAPNSEADADVTFVRAVQNASGAWTFHVTVVHPDTGWEDYADGWDVVLPDGTVLKPDTSSPFTRLLLHPHVNEQPFTRSQGNIIIPEGITEVTIRAHDIVHGFGGQEVVVDLTVASGENFEVEN